MAIFTVSNEFFTVSVDSYGAELVGMKSIPTGTEYLWCADAAVWGKTSPILFPYIGKVRDSYIKVDKQTYPMTKHGFARNCEFELVNQTERELTFELHDNDLTRGLYPFSFTFRVTYALDGRTLDTRFEVLNNSDCAMFFALGGHTAFSTEIADAKLGDYSVEFECDDDFVSECVDIRSGLLTGERFNCGKGRVLPMTVSTFQNDALIFENVKPKSLKLLSRKSRAVIRVDYKDFPNLAIWAAQGTDRFVCVEPWIAKTDSVTTRHTLSKKPGFVRLAENKTYRAAFQITVTE